MDTREESVHKFIIGLYALVLSGIAWSAQAAEHAYPNRTVTIVVPFTAGDGADVAARLAAEALAKALKGNFVVMNRPGAGGAIGVESVLQSPKDGYTILFTTNTPLTIRRVVYPGTTSYDPFKDLVPLGVIARFPSILAVRNDSPYKNLRELVEYGKGHPGALGFSTPGFGSLGQLNLAILNAQSGAGIRAILEYKGSTPAVTDLLGGHVDGVATSLGAASSHIRGGALRAIAISKKFPGFDIPTLTESGYREDILGLWVGFFAVAGTPQETVDRLVPAIKRMTDDRGLSEKLLGNGMLLEYIPPAAVEKELDWETKTVASIVKKLTAPK